MFKIGDKVKHLYGFTDETVKAVGELGGRVFVLTEEDPSPYEESLFTLVKPQFPQTGMFWQRRGRPNLVNTNRGMLGREEGDGFLVHYSDGDSVHLSRRFIEDEFEELEV